MPRGSSRQAKRKLYVWSNRGFAELDGRLCEAREERKLIKQLTEHVGGDPSFTQKILIKRTARLVIMLSQLERNQIERGGVHDLGARQPIQPNQMPEKTQRVDHQTRPPLSRAPSLGHLAGSPDADGTSRAGGDTPDSALARPGGQDNHAKGSRKAITTLPEARHETHRWAGRRLRNCLGI